MTTEDRDYVATYIKEVSDHLAELRETGEIKHLNAVSEANESFRQEIARRKELAAWRAKVDSALE